MILTRLYVVIREAIVSARSQPLATIATLVLVATMCAAVLLTSGRAVGAQQAVLATIDSEGTRSIVIRASPEAGLDSTVLQRFEHIQGIESAVALGSVVDVRNALLPDGTSVPLRDYWGEPIGTTQGNSEAVASKLALRELGMQVAAGAVTSPAGVTVAVVGQIDDVSAFANYEPLLLTLRSQDDIGKVGVVVVIATEATLVSAVAETLRPLISADDPSQIKIETSEALALLRGTVDDQLGVFGNTLAAGVLILAGALVCVVQSALVLLKRKDFGRRRALGATRRLIIGMVLLQTGSIAAVGALAGFGVSTLALVILRDPVPDVSYATAVMTLSVGVSLAAGVFPAALAARRDPIKELRVP